MSSDPLAPSKTSKNTGGAAIDRGSHARWELGAVVVYHSGTHSADVRTLGRGGRLLTDVAQVKQGPGSFEMLEVGTSVVISWDLGFMPLIMGVIDIEGRPVEALGDTRITGTDGNGVDDPLQPVDGLHNYRPSGAPPDLMPGDWAKTGDRGQSVSVLKGGVTQVGSPTAQMRSLGLAGLLQFIAQTMQGMSDWGQWDIQNEGGKTSFILRAGSDQSTQSGFDEEHWTIRLDLGATGGTFNFEITTPEGQTLFRFAVGDDGHFQIYGNAGGDISTGPGAAGMQENHQGSRNVAIQGDLSESIDGNVVRAAGKTLTESVGADRSTVIANDEAKTVNRDEVRNIGGKDTEIVAGGASSDAQEGKNAKELFLVNGGYLIDIGDPAKGASQSAKQSFQLKTYQGAILIDGGADLTLKAKQTAQLDGQTVNLGAGKYALPLWPTFRQDLYNFLTLLIADLQAGTAGTPVKQQLVVLTSTVVQLQQFVGKLAASAAYDSTKCNND